MGDDGRLDAPAFHRNHPGIGRALESLLAGRSGHLVEVGSGTGQHAVHLAATIPQCTWWPSDCDPSHLRSIEAWRRHGGVANLKKPFLLDARAADWNFGQPGRPPAGGLVAMLCINVLHITPWAVSEGILRAAGRYLGDGGHLLVYGPFLRDGRHTAESNARFDASLRRQDPAWGVRDSAELDLCARRYGLSLSRILPVPSNNFILYFSAETAQSPEAP